MKRIFLFIALLGGSLELMAQEPVTVMSFNIRMDTKSDSANAWPFRKDMAASQILFHEADIVGVQEALHHQMTDLSERLKKYKYIGGGRDDGKERGEYSAIFYNEERLEMIVSETFWLSPTPAVPGSKGWDAAITRVVTWGRFKDKRNGKEFFVFNTHFDHIGKEARKQSARLILQKIKDLAGSKPVILTGDFNANPNDEPIQVITDKENPMHLVDAKSISATPHYGPTGTFSGFGPRERTDQPIDYIFVRNGVTVLKHATLSETWQGRFSSDHFPILARVLIP